MSLCIYDAINDILAPTKYDEGLASEKLEDRLAELCDKKSKIRISERLKERDNQILQLRLYRLAKQVVPWDSEDSSQLPEALGFLQEHIIEENTWKTFTAFSDAWPKKDFFKELYKHLPEIDEEESDSSEDENIIVNNEKTISFQELSSLKSEIGRIKFLIYAVIALIIILLISK